MAIDNTTIDLLFNYLDDSLDPAQRAMVEERIKNDPAIADLLISLARNETVLREWSAMIRSSLINERIQPISSIIPLSQNRWRISAPVQLAFTLAMLLVVGWILWDQSDRGTSKPSRSEIVGKLEDLQGEAFLITESGEALPIQSGQALKEGQTISTSEGAVAVVRLSDATRVEMNSDTVITLPKSPMPKSDENPMIYLQAGMVHADIPAQPQGKSLLVKTPHAVIRSQGSKFNSSTNNSSTRVEVESGHLQMTRTTDGQAVDMDPGRYIVTATQRKKLASTTSPTRVTVPMEIYPFPSGPIASLLLYPQGESLAIATWDASLVFRNLKTGEMSVPIRDVTKRIRSMALSPDGKFLATGSDDRIVRIRKAFNGSEVLTLKKTRFPIDALAFSPNGTTLATSAGTVKQVAELRLWDTTTGLEKVHLKGHSDNVLGMAFDPNGQQFISGSKDGIVKVWDLQTDQVKESFDTDQEGITALTLSADGRTLATGGRDGSVKLWDLPSMTLRTTLEGHAREITSLAFAPNALFLASAANEPTIRLWDLQTNRAIKQFVAHRSKVGCIQFSPDSRFLISGGWDRAVKVWNLAQ